MTRARRRLARAGAVTLLCVPFLAGCRDAVERRAREIAALREEATEGIIALEVYCEARDSALAAVERGDAGAERWLEETLYAPDPVDDFCEEFRFHSHEEAPDTTAPPAPPDTGEHTHERGAGGA